MMVLFCSCIQRHSWIYSIRNCIKRTVYHEILIKGQLSLSETHNSLIKLIYRYLSIYSINFIRYFLMLKNSELPSAACL